MHAREGAAEGATAPHGGLDGETRQELADVETSAQAAAYLAAQAGIAGEGGAELLRRGLQSLAERFTPDAGCLRLTDVEALERGEALPAALAAHAQSCERCRSIRVFMEPDPARKQAFLDRVRELDRTQRAVSKRYGLYLEAGRNPSSR